MSERGRPAAIHIAGKVTGISIGKGVFIGGDGIVVAEGADVSDFKINHLTHIASGSDLLAQIGLPSDVDSHEVANIVERVARDPKAEISAADKSWLSKVAATADITTILTGIAAAASHPNVATFLTMLRNLSPS